jgi:hypothetical protein
MSHDAVKTPDQLLNEQEKRVLHLYDELKWTLRRIGGELGLSMERVRQCRSLAKAKLAGVAQHGEEALALLPARAARLVQFYQLGTRDEVRQAILSRRITWSYWGHGLCIDGSRVRNAGWNTWEHLHLWARLPLPVDDHASAHPDDLKRPWREQQRRDEWDAAANARQAAR